MTTPELINKHERLLYSAKGRAQYLKNKRWIDHNYKGQPTDLDPQIQQTEAEITEHRRTLKSLYQTI
jgi:hypothetical protein